ncbi:MAG: hypothetical protein K2O32_07300 [Acetatifactor sp.]|nr:hypothetical protein [Acetatifactor sp.]
MPETEGCFAVGSAVLDAVRFTKESPPSEMTSEEGDAAWQKNTKYKSWVSFWKHNHFGRVEIAEDGQYKIYTLQRSEKRRGLYTEFIKLVYLPADADVEEIGRTVIDVLEASEEYYKDRKESEAWRRKVVELLDETSLTVIYPKDRHFEDCEDCNAAEIYQCYEYHTQEGSESSADFFVGMATELDCSLEQENVASTWQRIYGKADYFEMKEANHGIFKLRAEMRNKDCHKISYFLQTAEDLLLECGMQVHQPNRRKKLDEKLAALFEEFALGCSF